MKRLYITITVLLLLAVVFFCLHMSKKHSPVGKGSGNLTEEESDDARDFVVEKLMHQNGSHFSKELAEKIYDYNRITLDSYKQWAPQKLDEMLALFADLSHDSQAQNVLMKHPEMGTLMACISRFKGDTWVAKFLKTVENISNDDYPIIADLYGEYATPEAACELVEILSYAENEKYIINLIKHKADSEGVLYCRKLWLLSKEDQEAAKVFQKWLYDQFDILLQMSPVDELEYVRKNLLLSIHVDKLAELLKRKDFRERFLDEFWPEYENQMRNVPEEWEMYYLSSDVWEKILSDFDWFKRDSKLYISILNGASSIVMDETTREAYEKWKNWMIHADAQLISQLISIPDDQMKQIAPLFERNLSDWIYTQITNRIVLANVLSYC